MLSGKNNVVLTGNLVADPEKVGDKVLKLRMAVSFAGQDRDNSDDRTGFFSVTYFLNDTPNAKFVSNQIGAGNLKKGSGVTVLGSLMQERWSKDGQKSSQIVIYAESIDYAGGARPQGESGGSPQRSQSSSKGDDESSEAIMF